MGVILIVAAIHFAITAMARVSNGIDNHHTGGM